METANKLSLQDTFLSILCKDHVPLSLYLSNGIRLLGHIEAFDAHIILLKGDGVIQTVYKHAISSIVPSRPINFSFDSNSEAQVVVKRRTHLGLKRTFDVGA